MAEAKKDRWHRLDNTANIFPVITSRRFSNVYRIAVNLDEPVDAELLQRALVKALPWFDAFKVRLRRGFFWHYLETNDQTPLVQLEDDFPCVYIDPRQNRDYLFRMTYYGNRVNLDVFHVLTDGTGAIRLLQAVVCQYLMLAHPTAFTDEDKAKRWFAQHAGDTEDSYVANYTPTKKANFRMGRGYKLRGERTPPDVLQVTHAHIHLPPLKTLCKQKGVTVGQYLTACIAWSVYTTQLAKRPSPYPLNIFLPVNLRPLFDSTTSLNFFSNIYISLSFGRKGATFEEILAEVKKQFEEKVTREGMLEKISYTVGSGYAPPVRAVPLPLKNLFLRFIFMTSAQSSSLSFTNVGVVRFPESFNGYVTGAHALLSTAPREPFKAAALSWGDTLTLSFTSSLRSTMLQRGVVRKLCEDGLAVSIETNEVSHEEM